MLGINRGYFQWFARVRLQIKCHEQKDTGKAKGILLEDCIVDDNYHELYVTVDEGESYFEN